MVPSKALFLQSIIYGANLYSELSQLRQQYLDNKYVVFYFSKGITHLELFVEFFYEILNENCDPLLFIFESGKAILRLIEYDQLLRLEKINVYIDMDAYREMKRLKEIKEAHFYLVRSKRKYPKLKNFKVSNKLKQLQEGKDMMLNSFSS